MLVSRKTGSASVVVIHVLTSQRQVCRPGSTVPHGKVLQSVRPGRGLWGLVNDEHDLVRAWGNLWGYLHGEETRGSNHGRRFNRPHGCFSLARGPRPVGAAGVVRKPPLSGAAQIVTFPVAADLGGDYSLGVTDQRHRLTFNGLWQIAAGFQVSGIYFFGSGEREDTTSGEDLRDLGGGSQRLRRNGTIIPRAGFVGDPIHRVDIRLQQRVPLGGRVRADGILEVFNLFNRANYGSYVTNESSRQYGDPQRNANIAYSPRAVQLGFRFTF